MVTPGLVVRIFGKNKEQVEVQFSDKIVHARNFIKNLQIGDYVILKDDLVIERISKKN
ncbi:MAG: hypothetical protein QXK76_02710 [Candidatus Woesearchaeota archaeon]